MMNNRVYIIFHSLYCLTLLLFTSVCSAQVFYISDRLSVPMHEGAGEHFPTLSSNLKSGSKVTLLDSPGDGQWAQVTTESGMRGWLKFEYLVNKPPASAEVTALREQLKQAQLQNQQLQKQLADAQTKYDQLQSSLGSINPEHVAELQKSLETTKSESRKLSETYQQLVAEHALIQAARDALQADNDHLRADQRFNEWMFGAGLVVLGMLLMLILPAFKPRSRNSDWIN